MQYACHVQPSKYWCFEWGWRTHVQQLRLGAWGGCVRPGTAPHAWKIATLGPVSLAMEPLISHILMADSSAGERMHKPFIDIVILQTCLYPQNEQVRCMCLWMFTWAHRHTAVTRSQHARFFSVTEKIAHKSLSCFFCTVEVTDSIFLSDCREILQALVFYQSCCPGESFSPFS